MDLTTLRAVLNNLRAQLLPSRFEKAQQPDGATLQLGFRSLQGMIWLELSWQADAPRLVQIPAPPRQGAGSTLAQQVQHSLRQMALVGLEQQGYERVIEFQLASRPGDGVSRVIVLELMGRHSNLLLLDRERRVIALGRQVRDHQSRVRPISTGDLYGPPPALQGHPPSSEESFERWRDRLSLLPLPLRKALQQTYQGISPPLARQLAGQQLNTPVNELTSSAWQALHQRWRQWLDSLNAPLHHLVKDGDGGYSIHVLPSSDSTATASSAQADLALQLGNWYRERLDRRELNRTCQELIQRLQRWKTKELSALSDQRNRLAACAESESLQQKADALLCLPCANVTHEILILSVRAPTVDFLNHRARIP